jgi:hypothetical protein
MPEPKNDIPLALFAECFDVDPGVGSGLRWRFRADMPTEWNTRWAEKPAGTWHIGGYWYVGLTFDGRKRTLKAHRIIYALTHGRWPAPGYEIDHQNGVEAGNGAKNLRPATHAENCQNQTISPRNTSGFPGVYAERGKWTAQIEVGRQRIRLGAFNTREEAYAAYLAAKALLHPFAPIPRGMTTNILPRDRWWAAQRILKAARRHRDTTLEVAAWEAFEPVLRRIA